MGQQSDDVQALVGELEQVRQQLAGLEAERSALAHVAGGPVTPSLLAERETQLTMAMMEAVRARQQVAAFDDERTVLAKAAADAAEQAQAQVASLRQSMEEGETQVQALLNESQELRQRLEAAPTAEAMAALAESADAAQNELRAAQDHIIGLSAETERIRAELAEADAARIEAEQRCIEAERRAPRVRFTPVRLRRVVEMAGLAQHGEFAEAGDVESFADQAAVRMLGSKRIDIHSLPSLNHYEAACDATSDIERARHMTALAAEIRRHLAEIPSVPKHLGVAYRPGDALLGTTLEFDPDLLEHAAQRGVVVATPNILVGLLGTVASSWRQSQSAEEVRELRQVGKTAFEQIASLSQSIEGLRTSLGVAVSSFN
ncbi:MAG: DNA recombination protein RmuC [Acidobacteria bacterium]|nr:DNA recombination protein RmuC [Acidobacteriota bacterium]